MDNDELRDAWKENGIGRPSTRAAIIETLFKRNYIRKERKNLFPTATGVELIDTIQEELLKSAELTGLWEKKLRQIERGTYKDQNQSSKNQPPLRPYRTQNNNQAYCSEEDPIIK